MMKRTAVPKPITKGVCRPPVVMQMEATECGAACLSMILAYYRRWVPLEQMREDCGVSRDGSRAANIIKAARDYGLDAAGYRYEPDELRRTGRFPCIIHWDFNHFVVLDGFRGNRAYLSDPARGAYYVTMEQFDRSFTGVCLMFEPTATFRPGGKPKSIWTFVKKRMRGTTAAITLAALTTLISSLLSILDPAFARIFMDRLLTGENPDWLYPFLAVMGAAALISLIIKWIQATYQLRQKGKLAIVANATYMWHVLNLPMPFFSQRMAGDIAMRRGLNETVAETLIDTFAPLLLSAMMMVFYLVVMLRYSVLLSAVGIASILIDALMSFLISKKRVSIMRVQTRDEGKLASLTVSGIEMIETIKSSGAEDGFFGKWAGYQAGANAQNVRYEKLDHYLGLLPSAFSALSGAAVLMLGVYLTLRGSFTVGMIMAFQGYLTSFTSPAKELITAGQAVEEMRAGMERIEDVMAYPADHAQTALSDENATYHKLSGSLEMKDVSFGYYRLGAPLIEHFDMTLTPGRRVALVGASGCGKSTVAKLISGLYKPWSGEILFDGKPIDQIDRGVFTGSVAVVDQDVTLFEDTIANNIRMWDESIEDFEVILAARDASLHEDVMARAGGYQAMLTEGGGNLSGGQRQRVEIARVLAADPTIIIMDEATSALDAQTEYEVVRAIRDRGMSCVIVAHRLSTVRDCDEIIVLDHGHIAERGTHEELYHKGGLYAQLVSNE